MSKYATADDVNVLRNGILVLPVTLGPGRFRIKFIISNGALIIISISVENVQTAETSGSRSATIRRSTGEMEKYSARFVGPIEKKKNAKTI